MKRSLLAGVFLVSLTGLAFEVLLTRVFSSLFWYHFAFVAISSALLGWGLGAYALAFIRKTVGLLHTCSVLTSLSILLFLGCVLTVTATNAHLPIFFVFSLLPFFFGGMAIATAFQLSREISGKLYFLDLFGASLGALSAPLLLNVFNPESLLLLTAVLSLAAAISFRIGDSKRPTVAVVLLVLEIGFLGANVRSNFLSLPVGPEKALSQQLRENDKLHVVRTEWNSFSRVDLVEGYDTFLAGIYIDTFAWTFMIPWNESGMEYTHDWFRYLPYSVKPAAKVLIIGTGGGTDVSLALASGSKDVTGVEINPTIVGYVRSYGKRAGNIYDHPFVHLNVDEGRNFVSRSTDRFDMVLLGFVDSSSAIVSGGLVISENYLYTVEAFTKYLEKVKDDGALAFVRYEVDIPRLVTMAKEALANVGVHDDLDQHIAVVSQTDPKQREEFLGNQMAFVIKKSRFTHDEVDGLKARIDRLKLAAVVLPYTTVDPPYRDYLAGKISFADFQSKFDVNVFPVHDNNPFYFAYSKPLGLPVHFVELLAYPVVVIALLLAATVAFGKTRRLRARSLAYYACLGMGFMLVEIPILQKFILLFGRPTLTFSVILFSLLLCTSLGSLVMQRFQAASLRKLVIVSAIGVIAIAGSYLLVLDSIIGVLLPLSLTARIAGTFALMLPLGLFLGIPFPAGLRMEDDERSNVPLAWAVNGLASVLGSIAATVLGVAVGFTQALALAMIAYTVVGALSLRTRTARSPA
ncbi:MAG: hypothetical protein HYR85_16620 [Planctomycetes bacterium]|nr:hypothetical protein [Planctomycetota bacterium]